MGYQSEIRQCKEALDRARGDITRLEESSKNADKIRIGLERQVELLGEQIEMLTAGNDRASADVQELIRRKDEETTRIVQSKEQEAAQQIKYMHDVAVPRSSDSRR